MATNVGKRVVGAAIVAALVATYVSSALHFAASHHALDAHGRLVHVTASTASTATQGDAVSAASVRTTLADDCDVAAFQRQSAVAKALTRGTSDARCTVPPRPMPVLAIRDSRQILRLAPKSSPPA